MAIDIRDTQLPSSSSPTTVTTTNAEAGPSNLNVITAIPPLFLPPPGPAPPKSHLRSTQDLLTRFQLLSAYDKHVKSYITAPSTTDVNGQDHVPLLSIAGIDKGKGKERELSQEEVHTPSGGPMDVDGDGDDDDGGGGGGTLGEKKKRNNYRHLIKNVPGKHSMKKDDFLQTLIAVPPKQRIPITPFDLKTQREAFSMSLEGLKGWNVNALVLESAQAREDRKRRKEIKKQQKQGIFNPPPLPPINTQHSVSTLPRRSTTSTPTNPTFSATRTSTPALPGSKVGTPRSGTPLAARGGGTPVPIPAGPTTPGAEKRGKKREFDEAHNGSVVNGSVVNGNGHGHHQPPPQQQQQVKVVANAKAVGVNGFKPRPMKKQRVDMQGQARDVSLMPPQQQPTPQGVA